MLKRSRGSSGLRCIICAACNLKSASSVMMKQLKPSQLQSKRLNYQYADRCLYLHLNIELIQAIDIHEVEVY